MKLTFPPLFSETMRVANKHLFDMAKIALGYVFFSFLVNILLEYLSKTLTTASPNYAFVFIATTIISLLSAVLGVSLNFLFVILVVQGDTGVSTPFKKIVQYVVSRFVSLLITLGLVQLVTSIGYLFIIFPVIFFSLTNSHSSTLMQLAAFIMGIFSIIPSIYFSLTYSQSINFALIEGDGALTAMKKSWQLTKRSLIELFIVYILYFLVMVIPYLVIILGLGMIKPFTQYSQYIIAFMLSMFVNITLIFSYSIRKALKLKQSAASLTA